MGRLPRDARGSVACRARLPRVAQALLALAAVRAALLAVGSDSLDNLFALPQFSAATRPWAPAPSADIVQSQAQASPAAGAASSRAAFTGLAAAAVAAAAVRRKVAPQATAEAEQSTPMLENTKEAKNSIEAFWKFLRPHTIRGTILGASAMVARVLIELGHGPDWSLLPRALCGVVALLCGNGFIVGINQIYDVSIDVINKPFLPVAAKELSVPQAWTLCLVMAVAGTAISYGLFGPLIGVLYAFGLFLGTIYSVPPLRLKQSAVAAALIIATVRGVLLNVGVYYASRAALGVPFTPSYTTAFMTQFCTLYAIVIAVAKDLPDTEGDLENNIETFATKFGVGKVSFAAAGMLALNYLGAFVWTLRVAPGAFRPGVLLIAHTIMLAFLARGVLRLRKANFTTPALKAFYRLIWALFYSEYFLFPLI